MKYASIAIIVIGTFLCSAPCLAQGPDRGAIKQQIIDLSAARQPAGENAWPTLMKIVAEFNELEREEADRYEQTHDTYTVARYEVLYQVPGSEFPEFDVHERVVTRAVLERARTSRLFDRLVQSLSKPRYVSHELAVEFTEVIDLSKLAKAIAGEAVIQAEQGCFEVAAKYLKAIDNISVVAAAQPGAIPLLYHTAIRSLQLNLARAIIEEHEPDGQFCRFIMNMDCDESTIDTPFIKEAARLGFLWSLTDMYDENGSLLRDKYEEARERARDMAIMFDEEKDITNFLPELPDTWADCEKQSGKLVQPMTIPILQNYEKSLREINMRCIGVQIMAALRLYEIIHGTFPESLQALVPAIYDELPTDPLFSTPVGYRLLTDDAHGRPYLLYSYGADHEDNNGVQASGSPWRALKIDSPDTDFPINYVYNDK